jgi:chromate reductase, NAD(P)H dehydrogenase (quinone)
MNHPVSILGISGSPRAGSYNTRLLAVARDLLPSGVKLIISENIKDLPTSYYDATGSDLPVAVKKFRQEVKKADAVIFSTPQFNYTLPETLKIIIQWAREELAGKPGAVVGASVDTLGTQEAQKQLVLFMRELTMRPYEAPLINLISVDKLFDPQGKLVDQKLQDQLKKFLSGYLGFISSLK